MNSLPPDALRGCDHGGATVQTLHQLADPARSSCQHTSPPTAIAQPQLRRCGQRADLKDYRQP